MRCVHLWLMVLVGMLLAGCAASVAATPEPPATASVEPTILAETPTTMSAELISVVVFDEPE